MKTVKMKYKDYELPSNPSSIEICAERKLEITPVFSKKSVTESISICPSVITARGRFYCDDAIEHCEKINQILKENDSGILKCPGLYPTRAFLSNFTYEIEGDTDAVKYCIVFTEDCDNSHSEKRNFSYTFAMEGENAFDIAHRCGVSVDDIMMLNDYVSPFDIKKDERVKIR